MKKLMLILLLGATASCGTRKIQDADHILVDVSKGRLKVKKGPRVVLDVPVETGRRGTGNRKGSRKTPLGNYVIAKKEPHHRFGPVMRLNGYQGFERGILFHRNLDGKPHGTNGCICPIDDRDYQVLWRAVPVGAKVEIRL